MGRPRWPVLPRRDQRAAGRAARPGDGHLTRRPAAGPPARRLVRDLAEHRGRRHAALPCLACRRAADQSAPRRPGGGSAHRHGPYGRHPGPGRNAGDALFGRIRARLPSGRPGHRPGRTAARPVRASADDRERRADGRGRGAPGRPGRVHRPPVHPADHDQPGAPAPASCPRRWPASSAWTPRSSTSRTARVRPSAATSTTSSPWAIAAGASCSATYRARTRRRCPSPGWPGTSSGCWPARATVSNRSSDG